MIYQDWVLERGFKISPQKEKFLGYTHWKRKFLMGKRCGSLTAQLGSLSDDDGDGDGDGDGYENVT